MAVQCIVLELIQARNRGREKDGCKSCGIGMRWKLLRILAKQYWPQPPCCCHWKGKLCKVQTWDYLHKLVYTEWRDQKISSRPIPRLFFETKIFETETETLFWDQIFSRPIPRLFFETKCFRDRYRDFFSRPNVFETDTETFLRPNFFETDTETFAKVKK